MEKNDLDKFWDIEELLPARPAKKPHRPAPRDTDAVEIPVASEKSGLDRLSDGGVPIPMREEKKRPPKKILREYEPSHGLIRKVSISPWPTEFGFYTKFRRDAIRLFERTHEPCEYVYFFSYMPQYDQMTASQLAYYLYWREELRRGIFLKTDINYLFLYIYELINLPDRVPPKEGAVILSRLWAAYRDDFTYLDKYLGEWLCDYCLVHRVEPDWVTLDVFTEEIAMRVSLPEFYLRGGEMTFSFLRTLSAYDYRKSKYYEDNKALFDEHIPKAVEKAAKECLSSGLGAYGVEPVRVLRDSFSGAVACHDVKFKITVVCSSLRRSPDLKTELGNMVKLAENGVRAVCGIKSRFLPKGVGEGVKNAIAAYFEVHFPGQNRPKKKENPEEAAYMALYEPKQTGKADISRALAIEEAAWETAELLDTGEEEILEPIIPVLTEEPKAPAPAPMMQEADVPEGEYSFLLGFDLFFREAVKAALSYNFDAYCRSRGRMAETVRDTINEAAMEALGDIIIEEDFSLVADYAEEIAALFG